jgi:hypothetical protein
LDDEFQKEVSEKIMDVIREKQRPEVESCNVIELARYAKST